MLRPYLNGLLKLLPVSFLVILCGVLPSIAAEPQYLEIRSAHFTVVTDAGEKKAREVAMRFEQMRSVFGQLLVRQKLHMPVPLTIIALKDDKRFYQTAPLYNGQPISAPGFFVPGEDHQFFVLNVSEEDSYRAVAHDFAHLLLNYNYPPTPGWFDEGFAEYFSSIRLDNKQVEIGSDPELALTYKEDILGNQNEVRNPPKSLTELLSGWVWLSIPDLFSMRHETWSYQEGTHRTLFYAQSWMMMHYLMNKEKLSETGKYFDLVHNQNVPMENAIQQAYGMTTAQLDKAVKDYFHSLTQLFQDQEASRQSGSINNRPELYHFPSPIVLEEMATESKPVSESDMRCRLAEIMVRIPERREQGIKEVDAVLKITDKKGEPVDNEIAHRVLAWVDMQKKEFPQAAQELGNAAALDSRDISLRYYLSLLKYRMAQTKHEEIQGLPNMMIDLKVALDWYPEFAEAYNMLAMARIEGGGAASALEAIKEAIRLSPRNEQYVFNLGQINESGKKWDAARSIFEHLKESGNPKISEAARHELEQLATVQKYGITPNAPKHVAQSSPFDELEQEAQKRAQAPPEESAPDNRPTQFLKGTLIRVDCSHKPAAVLTVTTGAKSLKLRTSDYKTLLVMGEDGLSCEWKNRGVSVNYKPGGVADGDLVSVEVQ